MILLTPVITPKTVWKCIYQQARMCNNLMNFDRICFVAEICQYFERHYNIDADYLFYTMGKLALSIT